MNKKDPRKYFDEWLTAYSDHLHMVRQGRCIDLAQPESPKPPIGISSEKSADKPAVPRKPSA
ncbi:MAG TPA: hypothetical protein VKE71_10635 [Candidatus Angelobacter sp.]|nr:hypothetical protein [Candidatus Angelobacter sp.]